MLFKNGFEGDPEKESEEDGPKKGLRRMEERESEDCSEKVGRKWRQKGVRKK